MAAIQLCLITDRTALGRGPAAMDGVVELCRDASAAGIDLIQIREKDVSARELFDVTVRVVDAARAGGARVLVNDRFDIALAANANGVHLTTRSMDVATVRAAVGSRLVVGVSTHSGADVRDAASGGADFVVCGPVFETPSKNAFGKALGPDEVARIASWSGIPVLGLGGIDPSNAATALNGSIAGIAAIRMFQDPWKAGGAAALQQIVRQVRAIRS